MPEIIEIRGVKYQKMNMEMYEIVEYDLNPTNAEGQGLGSNEPSIKAKPENLGQQLEKEKK